LGEGIAGQARNDVISGLSGLGLYQINLKGIIIMPIEAKPDFVKMELDILTLWNERGCFGNLREKARITSDSAFAKK